MIRADSLIAILATVPPETLCFADFGDECLTLYDVQARREFGYIPCSEYFTEEQEAPSISIEAKHE